MHPHIHRLKAVVAFMDFLRQEKTEKAEQASSSSSLKWQFSVFCQIVNRMNQQSRQFLLRFSVYKDVGGTKGEQGPFSSYRILYICLYTATYVDAY